MTATFERESALVSEGKRVDVSRYLVAIPLTFILFFAGYPLIRVLLQASRPSQGRWGTEAITATLASCSFREAVWNTMAIALASTLGCLALGTLVATFLAFAPFQVSGLASQLIDVIVVMPSFLMVLAFVFRYGSSGTADLSTPLALPAGVVAAEITYFVPFVIRPLLAAYGRVPAVRLNVAASLGASPARVFALVLFPEIVPTLAASGRLIVVLTINEFGIVAFASATGVQTLPMRIYTSGIVNADIPAAAVCTCVQIFLSLTVFYGFRLLALQLSGERTTRQRF